MTLSEAFSSRPFADGSENAATRTLEPRRASGSGSRIWGAEAVQDVAPVSMTGVRQVESGGFRSLFYFSFMFFKFFLSFSCCLFRNSCGFFCCSFRSCDFCSMFL